MARSDIGWEGQLHDELPFLIDNSTITYNDQQPYGSAQVGKAVKYSGNKTIALATDGSEVIGKLIRVEKDGKAAVQVRGMAQLPSTGTITRGTKIVGSTVAGNIRSAVAATAAEVAVARGLVGDVSDAAAVWVDLG